MKAQGLTNGLEYFEKRLLILGAVLKDRGIITEEELRGHRVDVEASSEGKGLGPYERGVVALTNLLIRKKVVEAEALRRKYEQVRARTPMTGARIVAKAWVDPGFRGRLKRDPRAAVRAWDPSLLNPNSGESAVDTWRVTRLEILENTSRVRNVVVCTLCSCYPRGLLGEPPEWYTSDQYREGVVRNPRAILKEHGMRVGEGVEVRVYDSTADVRYLVLPVRPRGTEGWSEAELAKLVTRDSLIGVADPLPSMR